MRNEFESNNDDLIKLTDGELKIVKKLKQLNRLWKKHGHNLVLFNGCSLRYKTPHYKDEFLYFDHIIGDGGDGGIETEDE